MKKINWFKLLLYISFVFLAYALYEANYLVIPIIYSYTNLTYSLFFLFLGTLVMCENWQEVLNSSLKLKISFSSAIISNGLSIFTKYIPGKLMVIMGRALYISREYETPIKYCSLASLQTQIISLWVGFVFGLSLFFFIEPNPKFILSASLLILIFSAFLFSKTIKEFIDFISKRFLKKEISYPIISFSKFIKILPSFLLNWIFWTIGFYFLTQALTNVNVSILTGLSFPLAATFAIIALISPGGLGVREGILSLTLIALGLDKQSAITVSLASRLWFLVGEFFIFILAMVLNKIPLQNKRRNNEK